MIDFWQKKIDVEKINNVPEKKIIIDNYWFWKKKWISDKTYDNNDLKGKFIIDFEFEFVVKRNQSRLGK